MVGKLGWQECRVPAARSNATSLVTPFPVALAPGKILGSKNFFFFFEKINKALRFKVKREQKLERECRKHLKKSR